MNLKGNAAVGRGVPGLGLGLGVSNLNQLGGGLGGGLNMNNSGLLGNNSGILSAADQSLKLDPKL